MSEFLKRWSARKHQALQRREVVSPEVEHASSNEPMDSVEAVSSVAFGEVNTDGESATPLSVEGESQKILGREQAIEDANTPPPAKPALPDKETLRAIFRTSKPDALDDYTQDFSQPELLPAALTAGLRNWLVDVVIATETVNSSSMQIQVGQKPAVAASLSFANTEPNELSPPSPIYEPETHSEDRDILAEVGGQNVPMTVMGMEYLGS